MAMPRRASAGGSSRKATRLSAPRESPAASAGQLLVGAEAAGGAPQELAGTRVLAELGHGDAAQGQRRRIVAHADPLEGAEHVAGGEGARGSGDQGIHDARLLRRADFAPRLLLLGCGRARLEIGSEVNVQPRPRPRRATADHPELLSPELRIIRRVIARFPILQAGLKSRALSGTRRALEQRAGVA